MSLRIAAGVLGLIFCCSLSGQAAQAQNQTAKHEQAFRPGTDGIGYPSCIHCPAPTATATAAPAPAIVVLEVTIHPNGRATDIKVVKSPGSRLAEEAVEAVRNWRFKPALDGSGKPVSTITAIEVVFGKTLGRAANGWGTGA